jgi:hypothetical protein
MPLYWLNIEDHIARHLSLIECFAKPQDPHIFSKSILGERERLYGVYINNHEDYIFVSDQAVHRIKGEKIRTIRYEDMREVDLPKDPEQRALYVHLKGGDTFLLPIANETEEEQDFYAFRNFLVAVMHQPHYSVNPEEIERIQDGAGLQEFLEKQGSWEWELYKDITTGLRDGFPEPWQLDLFKIDRELLENPGVWRLLALFLCRSCEEAQKRSQEEPPGSRTTRDIIKAIEIGKPPDAL